MIKYITGDILESQADIIVHGVNCVGGFGSGLAGKILKKYPSVRQDYLWKHKHGGWFLGDLQYCRLGDFDKIKYIVNAATQHFFGSDPNVLYCNYDAIEKCIHKVLLFAKREKYSVALPRIGCGLANGNWNGVVKPMLELLSKNFPVVSISVYSLENGHGK